MSLPSISIRRDPSHRISSHLISSLQSLQSLQTHPWHQSWPEAVEISLSLSLFSIRLPFCLFAPTAPLSSAHPSHPFGVCVNKNRSLTSERFCTSHQRPGFDWHHRLLSHTCSYIHCDVQKALHVLPRSRNRLTSP